MKTIYAYFHHTEIALPLQCVLDCSAQGSVDDAVKYWQSKIRLRLTSEKMIQGLEETGGWSVEELSELDDDELEQKVIWVAACNARDEMNSEEN